LAGRDWTWKGVDLALVMVRLRPWAEYSSSENSRQKDWCLCLEETSMTLSLLKMARPSLSTVTCRMPCRMSCLPCSVVVTSLPEAW
jgi:hypothetical protein